MHLESNRENKRKRYIGKTGRPAYDIPSEQVEGLRSMGLLGENCRFFVCV